MKILVVEDTLNSRVLLEEYLSSRGHDVDSACDGITALEKLEYSIPDLIISDILMPRMDGYEFCRRLKSATETQNIPFIFYTATYTESKDRKLALALGANEFVLKPVEPDVLLEIIDQVMAQDNRNRLPTISSEEYTEIHGNVVSSKLEKKIRELEVERDLLNRKERELRLVTDAIPTLVSHIDRNLRYCYVNHAYEVWHEMSRSEIIGRKVQDIVGDKIWKKIEPHILRVLSGDTVEYESELSFQNGEVRNVLAKYVPIMLPTGKTDGFIALVSDITEHINEQNEKQRLYEQLLQAQKMESIGHLVGGIAHDFNNILASMIGFTELTKEMLPEDAKPVQYLNEVLDTGHKARDLVTQMLTFGRGGHHDINTVKVNSSINSTLNLIRKLIPSSVDILTVYSAQDYMIDINTVQLQQLLMNLCINARDAMYGSGTITIQTSKNEQPDLVCDSCHNSFEGDFVIISVKDTGRGLQKETLGNIFEPFFSTKEVGQGSGMGLSVVHGVVHAAGGHIKVSSEIDKGTEFTLYFPESKSEIKVEDTKLAEPVSSRTDLTGSILVVDDEKSLDLYLETLLKSAGHQVQVFSDPRQALEHLMESCCKYDLIVTDYTMPVMNGIEFVKKARMVCDSGTPIILCTGYSDDVDKETALQYGVTAYFNKPFSSAILLNSVQELLGRAVG